MSHESANQNNSWSAKLMFRTRLRNIRYEYFGYDCAFTRKLAKPISIFLFRTSRTLLGREHKLLVSFNIANLFLTPRILCIIDDHFILSRISMLGTNEIGLELMLGCVSVQIAQMNETPAGISIETPFHFVKQVYVLPNLVIYFLHQ